MLLLLLSFLRNKADEGFPCECEQYTETVCVILIVSAKEKYNQTGGNALGREIKMVKQSG